MGFVVRQLTPDLWPALEDLFDATGPVGRCWCMYWRLGNKYRERQPDENRDAFHEVVEQGPPPGLVAFDEDLAVGWCQLTPRDALPWLDQTWRLKRPDDVPVWSISCFYIRTGYRKKDVTAALIAAALEAAESAGGRGLSPRRSADSERIPHWLRVDVRASWIRDLGRHVPSRPIMRFEFRPPN